MNTFYISLPLKINAFAYKIALMVYCLGVTKGAVLSEKCFLCFITPSSHQAIATCMYIFILSGIFITDAYCLYVF